MRKRAKKAMRRHKVEKLQLTFDAQAYGLNAPDTLPNRHIRELNRVHEGWPNATKALVGYYNFLRS